MLVTVGSRRRPRRCRRRSRKDRLHTVQLLRFPLTAIVYNTTNGKALPRLEGSCQVSNVADDSGSTPAVQFTLSTHIDPVRTTVKLVTYVSLSIVYHSQVRIGTGFQGLQCIEHSQSMHSRKLLSLHRQMCGHRRICSREGWGSYLDAIVCGGSSRRVQGRRMSRGQARASVPPAAPGCVDQVTDVRPTGYVYS
jgi:hypothetical protein